jgi:hypothetical protein
MEEKVDRLLALLDDTVAKFVSRSEYKDAIEWTKEVYEVAKIITVSRSVYFILALKNHKSSDEKIASLRIRINNAIVTFNAFTRNHASGLRGESDAANRKKRAFYMQFVLPEITNIPVCFSAMNNYEIYVERRSQYVDEILEILESDELNLSLISEKKTEDFVSSAFEDFNLKYYWIYFNEENIELDTPQSLFDAVFVLSRMIILYFALSYICVSRKIDAVEAHRVIKADKETAVVYRHTCLKFMHRCIETNNSFLGGCSSIQYFIRDTVSLD